jgi:predicted secreted hydrolase
MIGHAALSDPALGQLVHDQRSAREGFGLAWAKPADRRQTRRLAHDARADGSYRVTLKSSELRLELTLAPTQPPLLQGDAGYSRKGRGGKAPAITTACRS